MGLSRALVVHNGAGGSATYINDVELAKFFLLKLAEAAAKEEATHTQQVEERAAVVKEALATQEALGDLSGRPYHNLGTAMAGARGLVTRADIASVRRIQRAANAAKHCWPHDGGAQSRVLSGAETLDGAESTALSERDARLEGTSLSDGPASGHEGSPAIVECACCVRLRRAETQREEVDKDGVGDLGDHVGNPAAESGGHREGGVTEAADTGDAATVKKDDPDNDGPKDTDAKDEQDHFVSDGSDWMVNEVEFREGLEKNARWKLVKFLRARRLDPSGSKKVLVQRLVDDELRWQAKQRGIGAPVCDCTGKQEKR